MTFRNPAIGFAAVLTVVLLAGCGEKDDPPAPTTTTTAAPTTTTAAPSPFDGFLASPCSVLTEAQRTAISKKTGTVVPKGKPKARSTSPACEFVDPQHTSRGYYFVTVYFDTEQGLADMTKNEDFWKTGKLGDHQVIYYTHEGSQESCDVAIGFGDKSRVTIELYDFDNFAPREQGSCKGTKAVAEQVLATITGGR